MTSKTQSGFSRLLDSLKPTSREVVRNSVRKTAAGTRLGGPTATDADVSGFAQNKRKVA